MQNTSSTDQSEHEFLSFCQKINGDAAPWHSLYIGYSSDFDRKKFIKNMDQAEHYLREKRSQALTTFQTLNDQARTLKTEAVSYIFSDNDIVLLAKNKDEAFNAQFDQFYADAQKEIPDHIPLQVIDTRHNLPALVKLGNAKIDSARQMRALQGVANSNPKRDTLAIRRSGRAVPLVMVVEDDRFTAAYTTELLSKTYEVFHVRSGEEAVEYYLEYAPDAVFIDLHLPGMDGNNVLQLISALDPNSYCVMMSGDTNQASVKESATIGAYAYLRKPYTKERLIWTAGQSPHIKSSQADSDRR